MSLLFSLFNIYFLVFFIVHETQDYDWSINLRSRNRRKTQRNNNIRRRLFKEAHEISSITLESTTNFSGYAHIQPSDREKEVDIVETSERQCILGAYPYTFGVISFIGYLIKTHIITWPSSWKFATRWK